MNFFNEPLTVERVLKAYETIGYTAVQNEWIGERTCCGLSAVLCSLGKESLARTLDSLDLAPGIKMLASESGASEQDLTAFVKGFDGVVNFPSSEGWGWVLGCAVRKQLF